MWDPRLLKEESKPAVCLLEWTIFEGKELEAESICSNILANLCVTLSRSSCARLLILKASTD